MTTETLVSILPKDFPNKVNFAGSGLGNYNYKDTEKEAVCENIVRAQRGLSFERWSPFTWEQYKEFCPIVVKDLDRQILEFLCSQQGFLTTHTADDKTEYSVTKKFLDFIEQFKK